MTDDLVSRLRMLIDIAGRDASPVGKAVTVFAPILTEAADEIERLRAIVAGYTVSPLDGAGLRLDAILSRDATKATP